MDTETFEKLLSMVAPTSRLTLDALAIARERRGRGAKTPYRIVIKFCTER